MAIQGYYTYAHRRKEGNIEENERGIKKQQYISKLHQSPINSPLVKGSRNVFDLGDERWRRLDKLAALLCVVFSAAAAVSAAKSWTIEKNLDDQMHLVRIQPDSSANASQSLLTGHRTRRFPKYGTAEFIQQCSWARSTKRGLDCIFFVRPYPGTGEGIALWLSQITTGYLLARQAGCKVLLDYGPEIGIHEVLTPLPENQLNNWTVPSGFDCLPSNRCVRVPTTRNISNTLLADFGSRIGRAALVTVPWYRYYSVRPSTFRDLEQALPGFQVESGVACSLGNLFELAPSASKFEPQLFTRILPTLQDEEAFVIAIYIRTGYTDIAAKAEREGKGAAEEDLGMHRDIAEQSLKCALSLEEQHLSRGAEPGVTFSRVVWMLVTDSTYLKQWITESYDAHDANARVPLDRQKWKSQVIPREVVATKSRGVHSRIHRSPSTADFAEAVIDWYLIGESDLVVMGNSYNTYGKIAALRTARPVYSGPRCSKSKLVHERVRNAK